MIQQLNEDQIAALEVLKKSDNVFLTGAAGSGKSFLLRAYLQDKNIPILASTGAAAILVGGRTFHSFFGLGIMEGGVEVTIQRALKNRRLKKRLKNTQTVIIDEISMISGPTLRAAERISRQARTSSIPWGGLRVIAVGDFAQLPPVNPFVRKSEWAFLDPVWTESDFCPLVLQKIMRTSDPHFLSVLNQVRQGQVSSEVCQFLDSRKDLNPSREITHIFPHRAHVESFNLERLHEIRAPVHTFETEYIGKEADVENFKKHSPIAETLHLKVGALVMFRQNDVEGGQWVNGSLGRVLKVLENSLEIKIEDSGLQVEVQRSDFNLLNAEGEPVVTARNFPIALAWAMTIHKAQGTTLDKMVIDLRNIWEAGQAYVALSRVRKPSGLFVEGWSPASIRVDPQVREFHLHLIKRMTKMKLLNMDEDLQGPPKTLDLF